MHERIERGAGLWHGRRDEEYADVVQVTHYIYLRNGARCASSRAPIAEESGHGRQGEQVSEGTSR